MFISEVESVSLKARASSVDSTPSLIWRGSKFTFSKMTSALTNSTGNGPFSCRNTSQEEQTQCDMAAQQTSPDPDLKLFKRGMTRGVV
uniref:Uncharacterized protein n=1 Tax=Anguilla anguilla TaxID=7936 RepID=A0A0E9XZU4_ANGAN